MGSEQALQGMLAAVPNLLKALVNSFQAVPS